MQDDLDNKIAQLLGWQRPELIAEWERLHGRNVPRRISNQLLIRAVAYKWQEHAYGGFSAADQKLLERMAREFERSPTSVKSGISLKAGVRLRRLWQGKVYEVEAAADGFIHEGQRYGSLSEVARLITGTRWNGKLFFGLKQPKATARRAV